jgi:glycosyltransferase involved in cell wall biosynthesis
MKILILYDCVYPESIGGVEHRNHQLALALARRGHQVRISGWATHARSPAPGVEVTVLPGHGPIGDGGGRRQLRHALRWARAMASVDLAWPDVVETANIPHAHLFPLAARCRLARRPLVVTWHELWGRYWRDYVGLPWRAFAFAERLGARLGTVATAVSPLTAERLARVRRRGMSPVIPNGIPVATVTAAAAGQAAGAPLVYAGRLLADKRLDLLLRAVALLPSGEGRWLTVVGDGPERSRLEALASELGIAGAVDFLGRLPEPEDVWRHLGAARLAVQPSRREGFGLFPLEAMAAGLPVVYCSSPDSAVSSLVRDGVEGVEVAPESEALAAVLARLVRDDHTRTRMAAAAVARAAEHDWDAIAARLEEVFVGAIAAR